MRVWVVRDGEFDECACYKIYFRRPGKRHYDKILGVWHWADFSVESDKEGRIGDFYLRPSAGPVAAEMSFKVLKSDRRMG